MSETASKAESISSKIDGFDRFHTLNISCRVGASLGVYAEIDSFISDLSVDSELTFTGLGERWHEVSESVAQSILQHVLSHDLAYRTPEIPEAKSALLASEFLNVFGSAARFFTNGQFCENFNQWSGWGAVCNATFETGVVVVDTSQIGLLWCHDED